MSIVRMPIVRMPIILAPILKWERITGKISYKSGFHESVDDTSLS